MMDIIPAPKKNVIMDATTLSSLMSCGRYYDLRFNNRFTTIKGKSNSLEVGSLIHKVLEVYYDHLIKGFARPIAIGNSLVAGQLYVDGCAGCMDATKEPTCTHTAGEYPGVTNTPEHSEKYQVGYKFALETCEQYFEFYKNDAFVPLSAEQVKGEVLYQDDEIRVLWKAKFDLIVDNHQIGIHSIDHKTFKQRRNKNTMSSQFMGQCLLLKSRNMMVNKIGLQTSLKIAERLTREIISYSADRLLEWQGEILPYYAYKFIQYTESGYWPPNFTSCEGKFGMCDFVDVCEANKNMRVEVLQNQFQLAPVWDPTNRENE